MKKVVLTLTLALVALISQAQYGLGVKGGLSASKFYFGYDPVIDFKLGAVAGFYDRIKLSDRLSLQPELLYHSKGTLINFESPSQRDQFRMNLGYVEVPVALNVRLGNLTVGAGVYGAYLVNFNINKWNYDNTVTRFDEDTLKRVDYGWTAGLSYNLHGAILQLNTTVGVPIIGKPGGVFSRIDQYNGTRHVYKNASAELSLLIPFKL